MKTAPCSGIAAGLLSFTLGIVGGCAEGVSTGESAELATSSADESASESRAKLLPTPYCTELPSELTELDVCAAPPTGATRIVAEKCEIVQNECRFQASCSGGLSFAGNVTPTGIVWDTPFNYRCTGRIADGKVTGSCTQRGVTADAGPPARCELAAKAAPTSGATCTEDLPKGGFVLNGCGHEGTICTIGQRGCIWQADCGKDTYRARVTTPGVYEFTLASGARCSAQVKDGVFRGSCGEGASACTFASGGAAPVSGCLALPKSGFTSTGCGGSLSCQVFQSGCSWQAACANSNSTFIYRGTSSPDGVEFNGQNGFLCWADEEGASERLVGGCSRTGTRVSECSPRVEESRLVLTPR